MSERRVKWQSEGESNPQICDLSLLNSSCYWKDFPYAADLGQAFYQKASQDSGLADLQIDMSSLRGQ